MLDRYKIRTLAFFVFALLLINFQNCSQLKSEPEAGLPSQLNQASTSTRSEASTASTDFDINLISVRMGEPVVLRGPHGDEGDTYMSQFRLNNGSFRSFSANSNTYSIDSTSNWQIYGPRQLVLSAGNATDLSECGRWITSIVKDVPYQQPGRWFGLVHNETHCDYHAAALQTHKSMNLYVSDDEGLSWQNWGSIIQRDSPQLGKITGDGDCSLVNPKDGYLYAYCFSWPDQSTFVARAHTWALGPGGWMKYNYGAWGSAGLHGGATPLAGNPGASSLYFENLDRVGLLFGSQYFQGIKLSLAKKPGDFTNFVALTDPLVHFVENDWSRSSAASALYSYENGLNPYSGGNEVGPYFHLWYSFIPAGEPESQRYKVLQTVTMTQKTTKPLFQVGTPLIQWGHPDSGRLRTTSLPVLGNGTTWLKEKKIGYLMTRKPDHLAATRLEECRWQQAGINYDMIVPAGNCGGARSLGSMGWIFQTPQVGTLALYRCYNSTVQYHFATTSETCDGRGQAEYILGYIPIE